MHRVAHCWRRMDSLGAARPRPQGRAGLASGSIYISVRMHALAILALWRFVRSASDPRDGFGLGLRGLQNHALLGPPRSLLLVEVATSARRQRVKDKPA
jgi:hypothetical protein